MGPTTAQSQERAHPHHPPRALSGKMPVGTVLLPCKGSQAAVSESLEVTAGCLEQG